MDEEDKRIKPENSTHDSLTQIGLVNSCLYNTSYYQRTQNDLHSIITNKGNRGEFLAFQVLSKLYDSDSIYPNVYLPLYNGHTTEIDLILVTSKLVYVFECKYFSGAISGNYSDRMWKQHLKGRIYEFYNPLLQNKTHINALVQVFRRIPLDKFVSIVIFSDRCKFLTPMPENVLHRKDLLEYVNKIQALSTDYFPLNYVEAIKKVLLKHCRQDVSTKMDHIAYVNSQKVKFDKSEKGFPS